MSILIVTSYTTSGTIQVLIGTVMTGGCGAAPLALSNGTRKKSAGIIWSLARCAGRRGHYCRKWSEMMTSSSYSLSFSIVSSTSHPGYNGNGYASTPYYARVKGCRRGKAYLSSCMTNARPPLDSTPIANKGALALIV
jgi:hypothetical protein